MLQAAEPCLAELRVAVISDLNGSYGSTSYEPVVGRTVRELIALEPDLVISTGDMVAGQRSKPKLAREQVEAMWDSFHALVTDPIAEAGIPLAATPGNHDASAYPGFSLERRIYAEQWGTRVPDVELVDADGYPYRYAFAIDDVLFVSLDATRVGPLDAAQRGWLDALLRAEGPRFRHRVVFGHLPIYPLTEGRATEVLADRLLEQTFAEHGVDLYLSGHHHAFYDGVANGVHYIGQACLGAAPRVVIGSNQPSVRAVTWIVFRDDGTIGVDGLVAPALTERVDPSTLPRSIESSYGTLVRADLDGACDGPACGARNDVQR